MEIFTENSPGHRILPSIARLLSQVELVSYCWKPRTQLQKLCSKILMVAINRECYDTNLLLCLTFVHFSCMHNFSFLFIWEIFYYANLTFALPSIFWIYFNWNIQVDSVLFIQIFELLPRKVFKVFETQYQRSLKDL